MGLNMGKDLTFIKEKYLSSITQLIQIKDVLRIQGMMIFIREFELRK